MGYRIQGDGTYQNTKIWKDDVLVDGWENCVICVDEIRNCVVYVDGDRDESPSRVVLVGIYQLIGEGKFNNTKLIVNDSVLRGVSSIRLVISKGEPTRMDIKAIFLPNIVEGE